MSTDTEISGPHYDVIVIGGGASGMMAAGRAGECGKRVLLVEKNKVVGKKLSITGGGRCNITNAEKDTRKFLENYGDAAKFLFSPFSQFGMAQTFVFFGSKDLPLVTQARKRVFPESEDARDVTAVMKKYATKNGVTLNTGTRVHEFILKDGVIVGIKTSKGTFLADNFVLATGGAAHQETGSTGEGLEWLSALGHTVHEPNPNIVPLIAEEEWAKKLSGKTLSFMKITFSDAKGTKKTRFSKTGKILFTHFGVSGPLILNAAHAVKQLLKHGPVTATIDMYPDTEVGTLRNRVLEAFNMHKNKELRSVLKEFVPAGMSEAVAEQFSPELRTMRVHSVPKEVRNQLVDRLKAMPLTITGTMGLDWAVISDGGVELSEVDTKTMRSKKYPNLYFTGDVLHINRPSGGYSLQLCWTTGWVAGSNV